MNNINTLLKTASLLCMIDLVWVTTGGSYGLKTVELIQQEPVQIRYECVIIIFTFLAYMLLKTKSAKEAFLYGVCMYGCNDFNCYSLFVKYDWRYAIVETLWGGVLFVTSGYLLKLWS